MGFGDLLKKKEALVSIDIGASGLKLLELDCSGEKPRLVNIAVAPLAGDVFSNNIVAKTELVSEKISIMLEANGIGDQRAVIAMPGPSVFTKRIKMPKLAPAELAANVQLEAGSFIPHNVDAVKIDYHVIGETGRNQIELMVVAVKNEIIESFVECVTLAGLDTAVVDVDYFALQNCFEMSYPEFLQETVTLIDIGARYSSINICKAGQSLFTGDIAVGGRLFTEAIAEGMGVSFDEAETLKCKAHEESDDGSVRDLIDRKVEYVASEFNRQLSLFWNASGADEGIDRIVVCGGGARVPGLLEELSEKTGIESRMLEPLRGVECGAGFDAAYLQQVAPVMAVCVGMGLRQPGDKIVPDYS